MRVTVDMNRCASAGECSAVAPDVFEMDEDMNLTWSEHPEASARDRVELAMINCPNQAISIDESG